MTLDAPGFLLRTSTFGGDLNLIVQLLLGGVLVGGVVLARRGHYRAHGACQTTALAFTLLLTAAWMVPAFREVYEPGIERGVLNRLTVAVAAHVILGMLTLLLAGWVVLVAGTTIVPPRWRFRDYRGWMRTLFVLWWLTILFGVAIYVFSSL